MEQYTQKLLESGQRLRKERKLYEGLTREEAAERYYRKYHKLWGTPDRRETREYADAISRFLPCPPGSTPLTKALVEQLFRDKPTRVKRAEREERRLRKREAELQAKREAKLASSAEQST